MRLVKVAAATLNQTPLDWEGNLRNILGAVEAAKAAGVGILCLPELCITGYGCEDAFLAPGTASLALQVLDELLPHTRGIVVSVGLPVRHNKAVFNCCALLADGQVLGVISLVDLLKYLGLNRPSLPEDLTARANVVMRQDVAQLMSAPARTARADLPLDLTISGKFQIASPVWLKRFISFPGTPPRREVSAIEVEGNGDRWGYRQMDLALTKNVKLGFLTENTEIWFRVDIINLFNDRNYNGFDAVTGLRNTSLSTDGPPRTVKVSTGFRF